MAGGSDRLLRSQSKTQPGVSGLAVPGTSNVVGGPAGGGVPHQPPTRSSSNQQNWY
jgi:hypothetical protein